MVEARMKVPFVCVFALGAAFGLLKAQRITEEGKRAVETHIHHSTTTRFALSGSFSTFTTNVERSNKPCHSLFGLLYAGF